MRLHPFGSALSLLGLLLVAAPAQAGLLSYTLSSEMVKSGCAYDTDGDCLDNGMENQLAQAAVPWYFYDEDEDCSSWWQDPTHYSRKDYFQVRTLGPGLTLWQPNSIAKRVRVTYFWLHPHDCQSWLGWGGHLGDSEKVEYIFYSYDLKTWYLETGRYYHHNSPYHDFNGSYLANIAAQLGTAWASVAADEDGHGSWPGEAASKSACAGSEDQSYNDCFVDSMSYAFRNGFVESPGAWRNIGGPYPETWNASVVNVSGATAWSTLDVGHGVNSEYWSNTPSYNLFCGWECPLRLPDGSCHYGAHSDTGCSSGLHEKVDSNRWPTTACGDAICNGGESCSSCPGDCGSCPGDVCGDGWCGPNESCASCSEDCGTCSTCLSEMPCQSW